MENVRFGEIEARFADIVWEKAPITTRELIAVCEMELNWKRTTTYTVLKKFFERGIFKTEDSIVSALVTREYYYTVQSEIFLKEAFSGSLPAFIAAFTSKNSLTKEELTAIREMLKKAEDDN